MKNKCRREKQFKKKQKTNRVCVCVCVCVYSSRKYDKQFFIFMLILFFLFSIKIDRYSLYESFRNFFFLNGGK